MYQIVKDGKVIELQEKLSWVKYQAKNDIVISCNEEEGQGILCGAYITDENGKSVWNENAVIYSVVGKPQFKDCEFVTANELKWYPISTKQRADIDYLSVMTGVTL